MELIWGAIQGMEGIGMAGGDPSGRGSPFPLAPTSARQLVSRIDVVQTK